LILGVIYQNERKMGLAKKYLKFGLKFKSTYACFNLAKLYSDHGKVKKAKKYFKITEKYSKKVLFNGKEKETYLLVDHILMSLVSNIVLNELNFEVQPYMDVIIENNLVIPQHTLYILEYTQHPLCYGFLGEYYEYIRDFKNSIKFYLRAKELEDSYFNDYKLLSSNNWYEKAKNIAVDKDLIFFAINQSDVSLRIKYMIECSETNSIVAMNLLGVEHLYGENEKSLYWWKRSSYMKSYIGNYYVEVLEKITKMEENLKNCKNESKLGDMEIIKKLDGKRYLEFLVKHNGREKNMTVLLKDTMNERHWDIISNDLPLNPNIINIEETFIDKFSTEEFNKYELDIKYEGVELTFLILPFYKYSLREFIQKRKEVLNERQLFYIFIQFLNIIYYLSYNKYFHNNISIDSILINDDLSISLTNFDYLLKYHDMIENIKSIDMIFGDISYVFPQILKEFEVKKHLLIEDILGNDLFSMGMVLMQIAIKKWPFYVSGTKRIDCLDSSKYDDLNRHCLPHMYSETFKNLLYGLITIENRADINLFLEVFLFEEEKMKYPFKILNHFNDLEFHFYS
jgi:serine/threonine protein kinase